MWIRIDEKLESFITHLTLMNMKASDSTALSILSTSTTSEMRRMFSVGVVAMPWSDTRMMSVLDNNPLISSSCTKSPRYWSAFNTVSWSSAASEEE